MIHSCLPHTRSHSYAHTTREHCVLCKNAPRYYGRAGVRKMSCPPMILPFMCQITITIVRRGAIRLAIIRLLYVLQQYSVPRIPYPAHTHARPTRSARPSIMSRVTYFERAGGVMPERGISLGTRCQSAWANEEGQNFKNYA